jgi:hypothetical protein
MEPGSASYVTATGGGGDGASVRGRVGGVRAAAAGPVGVLRDRSPDLPRAASLWVHHFAVRVCSIRPSVRMCVRDTLFRERVVHRTHI